MQIIFTDAEPSDLDTLLPFAQEFNQEDHHPFDEAVIQAGLAGLLGDRAAGRAWLIRDGTEAVGYLVLTLGYRLAYGRYAFIDEIYVRPDYRSRGIGRRAIAFAEEMCRMLGVKALHLEVERENTKAHALYLAVGFRDDNHYLMTCWLADAHSHSSDPAEVTFKPARNSDIELLIELRQEAGAEGQANSRTSLGQVVGDNGLGWIWLVEALDQPVGYMAVTFSYSLEFHGRDALLDELYLRPSAQAFARPSLRFAQAQCQALGVNALHVEMERANAPAQSLYRAAGFVDDDSYLMTKWLLQ